jgi:hypothetical protein
MTRCNSEMEGAGVAGFNFTSDDVGGAPFPHALPGMLALSRRACGCLAVPPAGRMQHVRCVCVCVYANRANPISLRRCRCAWAGRGLREQGRTGQRSVRRHVLLLRHAPARTMGASPSACHPWRTLYRDMCLDRHIYIYERYK